MAKPQKTAAMAAELDAVVDVPQLLERLALAEDDLEGDARRQPGLYLEASRFRVQALWRRQLRMQRYEVARAHRALELREQKHSGNRMTEKEIEERVLLDATVRGLKLRLEEAFKLEEWGKALVEAYRQRQTVIKVIADIRNAEIASEIRQVRERMARGTLEEVAERTRQRLRNRPARAL